MGSSIQAVIFDMDGVLCHLDDAVRIGHLSRLSGRPPLEVRDAIWTSGFEDSADAGAFLADDYLEEFGRRLGCTMDHRTWCDYRRSGMTPIRSTLEIAAELQSRAQLAVLTNNGFQLQRAIEELFPELRPIFGENIFVSAEFKARKPEPEIFLQLCHRLAVEPSQAVMIDDREENVVGAREAGLMANLYTDELGLRAFLAGAEI